MGQKLVLLAGILFCIIPGDLNAQTLNAYNIPSNVHRILFLGNSITYSGQYITYLESYFISHYPEKNIEFLNLGLPSETVSGLSEPGHADGKFPRPDLHERLSRVLNTLKPDLVFACYGMNDGIYMPFDEGRFHRFKEGIIWLHDQVTQTGAIIIHITPPVYDERKGAAYANVLDIYADWLISCRYTKGWNVADIHNPMKKYQEDRRMSDSTFAFASDGVHPNDLGHWIIAQNLLLFLNEKGALPYKNAAGMMAVFPGGDSILNLVGQRQEMMKDSWLTTIGHKRPGMNKSLPVEEAQRKASMIDAKIKTLFHP